MEAAPITAIAVLEDDVRASLYAFVRAAGQPVSRAAAASAIGISAKLAAFHLDKLVSVGLLQARIEAVGRRRVGRTPKVYVPSDVQISVSIPPRQPQLLAEILAAAILDGHDSEPARIAVMRVARGRGQDAGRAERERSRPGRLGAERAMTVSSALLEGHGFEPTRTNGTVRMRNCPFHPLAQDAAELVCGINEAFIGGLIDGLGAGRCLRAVLAPADGECCVEIRPA